jgi:DNA repair protein RecN (Recombination protein N)
MLQKLIIKNYVIIDYLELVPDKHLNIVTGETGAGKSIILGALSLVLGERADLSVLINKEEKCIIEATFDIRNNEAFKQELSAQDLDAEAECIIRREISVSGKSRAFINDTPVNLTLLATLSSYLVDLQQQFSHLALREENFQLEVIDALAQNKTERQLYSLAYKKFKEAEKELKALQLQQQKWQQEADYKKFLAEELIEADFKENEIEESALMLKQMSHAERIISTLQAAYSQLEEGETPMVNELKRIMQQMLGISELIKDGKQLSDRLLSVHAELKDIAAEIQDHAATITIDAESMQKMQERIDLGYKLLKKHGLQQTAELLELRSQLERELSTSNHLNNRIINLQSDVAHYEKEMMLLAGKLTASRVKIISGFETNVNELIALVGMPNARFSVAIDKAPVSPNGADIIDFMLDANKSGQFKSLERSASGGELSRILLCIKSLTAKAMHLPTLVFDEVDTGISGEAAKQVGLLLKQLSAYHQVICITHQPQVAAKGSKHFFVYKEEGKEQKINTRVKELQSKERVHAIAQMIGGNVPGANALKNAEELIKG